VEDLVDPAVAEEVHHLGAHLVGLGERVGVLAHAEAVAEDAGDGGLEAGVGARDPR